MLLAPTCGLSCSHSHAARSTKHGRPTNFRQKKYFEFRFRSVPVGYPCFDGKLWIYIKNWVGKSLWSISPKVSVSWFKALKRFTYLPNFCPVLPKTPCFHSHFISKSVILTQKLLFLSAMLVETPEMVFVHPKYTLKLQETKTWRPAGSCLEGTTQNVKLWPKNERHGAKMPDFLPKTHYFSRFWLFSNVQARVTRQRMVLQKKFAELTLFRILRSFRI